MTEILSFYNASKESVSQKAKMGFFLTVRVDGLQHLIFFRISYIVRINIKACV